LFKVQVVCEAVHLSRGKSLLEKLSSVFFETQICPGPIATNGTQLGEGWDFEKLNLKICTKNY